MPRQSQFIPLLGHNYTSIPINLKSLLDLVRYIWSLRLKCIVLYFKRKEIESHNGSRENAQPCLSFPSIKNSDKDTYFTMLLRIKCSNISKVLPQHIPPEGPGKWKLSRNSSLRPLISLFSLSHPKKSLRLFPLFQRIGGELKHLLHLVESSLAQEFIQF